MILHHPFRSVEDLKVGDLYAADADVFPDFLSVYNHCVNHHMGTHPDFENDGCGEPLVIEEDDELWDPFDNRQENELFWAELAAQNPHRLAGELENIEALGNRMSDREYDWSQYVNKFDLPDTWLTEKKAADDQDLEAAPVSDEQLRSMSIKQRQIFNLMVEQAALRRAFADDETNKIPRPPQLLCHIDGRAGTGKSFAIHCISGKLQLEHAKPPILRYAPTGVAAHGINGRTLHSLFRSPIGTSKLEKLKTANLRSLQAIFRNITALIIDEKSMVSLTLLAFLDQRLREIFPHESDINFGGIDITLWGDFFQLPPVIAQALYHNSPSNEMNKRGRELYLQFDKTVELDMVMRQQGEDQVPFRQCLEGLRNNTVTLGDWKLMVTRIQSTLSRAEIDSFADALRLYGKKRDVNEYNHVKMRDLGIPVRQLKAVHTGGADAEKADWEKAGNLHKILPLCIGA